MNIYNQNVAFNYRGILNLDATTINTPLDATLRAVTDGTGTSSVLNLSTTQVNVGGGSALGRLVVRGDGTNPIARFENSGGTALVTINQSILGANVAFTNAFTLLGNTGTTVFNSTINANVTGSVGALAVFDYTMSNDISTSSTSNYFRVFKTISPAAGSANFRNLIVDYTINASGVQTGNATGIFLNATETLLNGMTHNLMDLQVGGVSKFLVSRAGTLTLLGNINASGGGISGNLLSFSGLGEFLAQSDGVFTVRNNAGTSFNRLQLGGTTSSFPSIKRNGAAIDFRLADDSANCNINTGHIFGGTGATFDIGSASQSYANLFVNLSQKVGSPFKLIWYSNNLAVGSPDTSISRYSANVVRIGNETTGAGNLFVGGSTGYDSTAILQADSTTKGFLMPRQTQAQILAIVTPANGLQVYNTDLNQPCFYDGTGWKKINHSPM